VDRQAIGQGAKIESRSADEYNWPLADLGETLARSPRPSAGRKIDRSVDCAEHPVRRKPLLVRRRPGGQDPQIPVDLHRIGVDDDRPEPLGERQRRRRFAARRRAGDEERPLHWIGPISGRVTSSVLVVTLAADRRRPGSAKQHSTGRRKPFAGPPDKGADERFLLGSLARARSLELIRAAKAAPPASVDQSVMKAIPIEPNQAFSRLAAGGRTRG
jgi:hypothetical protein